ncbi:acyl-CoA dehydrogenase family protein [soil metagenome]
MLAPMVESRQAVSQVSSPVPSAVTEELRRRSEEIEATRRIPADIAAMLCDHGLFATWIPADYGGAERSAIEGLSSIAAVAEADGAAGWCVMIALTTSMMAYSLAPEHAKEIYHPRAVTGGFAAPMGTAVPVEGGLRVTGRWAWGSGTSHCTTIGGGVRLVDATGAPAPRDDGLAFPYVFFDEGDVTLLDTWHAAGLEGTGSTDYTVTDAFVPEGRWVEPGRTTPVVDAALARFPLFGLLALGVASVSVGLLRRALEDTIALATAKRPQGSSKVLAERQTTQIDLAQAEAVLRSSWALIGDVVGDAWQTAQTGGELSVEQRRLLRLAATDATARCADAIRRLHLVAGGVDVYRSSPIQRAFRDSHVATQHVMVAERTYELAGRLLLDLPTDAGQL